MDNLDNTFQELFGSEDSTQRFFCPGRVNLIGEHIDYLGGLVMPAAISLGITAVHRCNGSSEIRIHSTDFGETITFDLHSLPTEKQEHWSDFVLGVILHFHNTGMELEGCDILIDSSLPKGAGLSSSAALEVLCYYMLFHTNSGTEPNRVKMALDCQSIENGFVGLNCGIMDQFAVACGKTDRALSLNCDTLEHEQIPLNLGEHSLLIVNTNKSRALANSAYNERRKECNEALNIIAKNRSINNLVDAYREDLELLSDPILIRRTRHAFTEQLRVRQSNEALLNGNLETFGKLMNESHASLRDDFQVSCDELDFIVNSLQNSKGCLGARMTGAGFGGCCIGLVGSGNVEKIMTHLNESYKVRFNNSPSFYDCRTSDGVHRIT